MKIPLLTSLTIAIVASIALASPAETELKTLVQQTIDAYVKADTDFLERAYAEEATFVNLDGTVSSKSQDLGEVAKKDVVFTSLKMTELKVRMLGENNALVTGLSTGAGKYKGETFDLTTRDAICYEKQSGNWRIIFWQSTEVKPEDEDK